MAVERVQARRDEKDEINVHDASDLRFWSNKFGVTQEQFLEAVRSVGNSAKKVKKYLEKSASKT